MTEPTEPGLPPAVPPPPATPPWETPPAAPPPAAPPWETPQAAAAPAVEPPAAAKPQRSGGPEAATLIVGLVFLAVGVWFLLDRTLGFNMPDIQWGNVWPVFLIGLGALVLFRAVRD